MAEMIPDQLPRRASRGEERLFDVLKRLPDDYIVHRTKNKKGKKGVTKKVSHKKGVRSNINTY